MATTFLYRADEGPAPSSYPSVAYSTAATDSTVPGGTFPAYRTGDPLDAAKFNRQLMHLRAAALYGCGGIGIVSGLGLTPGSGLTATVSAGLAMVGGLVEVATSQAIVLPASQARIRVYLLATGAIEVRSDATLPASPYVYLGSLSSSGSAAGADNDEANVIRALGPSLVRRTADRGAPVDTPNLVGLITRTLAGSYIWDGVAHRAQGATVYSATIGTDIVLNESDAETLILAPSGSNRKAILPSAAAFGPGRILHNGAASGGPSILVRDAADATTLSTLTPGQSCRITAVPNASGAPTYASGSISAL